MKRYNFAIIGSGYMASRYIKSIENHPRANLKLVVNRGRVIRGDSGAPEGAAFADDDKLCAFLGGQDDVDAVIVCSPDHTHVAYVSRLLASDKLILCEKPLARTEDEFRTLIELARWGGERRLLVGMNCRFRSRIRHLRELIRAGTFAGVKFVHASYHSNIAPILERRMKGWWLDYPAGVKPFLHGGAIHLFDALRYLLGDVREVLCIPASTGASREIGGDSFIVVMKFENGTVASVTITGTSVGPNRFQISMESDRCAVDENNQYVREAGAEAAACLALPTDDYGDLDRQLEHLMDVADGGAEPLNGIREAYRNFQVIRACEVSAASCAWTPVGAPAAAEVHRG
jgi:predicted dehydrogenase